MKFDYIDETKKDEWEAVVSQNPASGYMQSFFWTEFINTLGWSTYKIGIFDREKLIGGAIVGKFDHLRGRNFLTIPDGPVLPYSLPKSSKMFEALMSEIDGIVDLKGNKLSSHLQIEPKLQGVPNFFNRFIKSKKDIEPTKTLIIDLKQSEEKLLAQMKPKGRYNIKIAQKHGVKIVSKNPGDGIVKFVKLYKKFSKGRNMDIKEDNYFYSLAMVLEKYNVGKIYFSEYKNIIISAAIVINFGKTATFLYGASNSKYKKAMASYLLHWQIIKEAQNLGLAFYDLYGLSPSDDKNHPWTGFTEFKRKFGGIEFNTIGGYDFVYNPKLYKKYLMSE